MRFYFHNCDLTSLPACYSFALVAESMSGHKCFTNEVKFILALLFVVCFEHLTNKVNSVSFKSKNAFCFVRSGENTFGSPNTKTRVQTKTQTLVVSRGVRDAGWSPERRMPPKTQLHFASGSTATFAWKQNVPKHTTLRKHKFLNAVVAVVYLLGHVDSAQEVADEVLQLHDAVIVRHLRLHRLLNVNQDPRWKHTNRNQQSTAKLWAMKILRSQKCMFGRKRLWFILFMRSNEVTIELQ